MENSKLILLAELPGLEAAKQAIEYRIAQIQHEVSGMAGRLDAPTILKPLPVNDPSILGRDSIGRIKRKRNISPELRERKRQLIAAARESKLRALAESKKAESAENAEKGEPERQQRTSSVVSAPEQPQSTSGRKTSSKRKVQ